MDKSKKIIAMIALIIVMAIIITIFNIKNSNKGNKENIIENSEDGLTGLIDNEEYYYNKQKEYIQITEEYNELISQYSDEMFTEEQKKEIKEYEEKMENSLDEETEIQLSNEYSNKYKEYMEQQFTEEQKNEINEKKKRLDELEPIVGKYQDLIDQAQEKKAKEGLETLQDGKIINRKSGIIEDKEYNGIKYTNIQLIYNPIDKNTVLSMNIKNTTEEIKEAELVTLYFTGNAECKYPIKVEKLIPNETMSIEITISANLTYCNKFEVIKYE